MVQSDNWVHRTTRQNHASGVSNEIVVPSACSKEYRGGGGGEGGGDGGEIEGRMEGRMKGTRNGRGREGKGRGRDKVEQTLLEVASTHSCVYYKYEATPMQPVSPKDVVLFL